MSYPVHKNLFHWIKAKNRRDQFPWSLIVNLIILKESIIMGRSVLCFDIDKIDNSHYAPNT